MPSSTVHDVLLAEERAGVLTLTLNRPERRNALDAELRDALAQALDAAALDGAVRGVVLTGAGGAFCAGGDLDADAAYRAGLLSELADDAPTAASARVEKMLVRERRPPTFTGT
jgi:2-(1,2-epoxy-1,2-dihydrophenyl)acetyl-CoA isomerase